MVSPVQCSLVPGPYLLWQKGLRMTLAQFVFLSWEQRFIIGSYTMDSAAVCYMSLGGTVAQVAIAWLMHKPGVSSVIIGARTPQQLEDNLKSAFLALTAEEVRELVKFCPLVII